MEKNKDNCLVAVFPNDVKGHKKYKKYIEDLRKIISGGRFVKRITSFNPSFFNVYLYKRNKTDIIVFKNFFKGTMNENTKNQCGKMRKVNEPYEVYVSGSWTWRVLKKYQSPEKEQQNPYARWFCAVKTPFTPSYDMGDVYIHEIVKAGGVKVSTENLEKW